MSIANEKKLKKLLENPNVIKILEGLLNQDLYKKDEEGGLVPKKKVGRPAKVKTVESVETVETPKNDKYEIVEVEQVVFNDDDNEDSENNEGVEPEVLEGQRVKKNVEIVDLTKRGKGGKVKGKMCRRVPVGPKNRPNSFKDNQTESMQDHSFDKLVKHVYNKNKRVAKKYKVRCSRCNVVQIIDEAFLPVTFEGGTDGSSSYTCDDCIPGR